MSRNIIQRHRPIESISDQADAGKVIITQYENKICSFLLNNQRLLAVNTLDATSRIGEIHIGKVKNVVKNMDACFVEIADKKICFLPLRDAKAPFCLNRIYDGRILQGDEILVQVTNDAIKTKQASVTCNIMLQNSYFVFEAGNAHVGISTKLTNTQKADIKLFLTEKNFIDEAGQLIQRKNLPAYGVIIRTEAAKLLVESQELFLQEFIGLQKKFEQLFETARHRTCHSCIQSRKMPYKSILDCYCENDYEEVVTDLNEAYTSLQGLSKTIRLYSDLSYPLIKLYSLETKLKEALGKNVWLKSGANLIIEQTECLNTIDVNSGKKIKKLEYEDNIQQINVEAAYEAARQIRLRNLSGIIIIDFINMEDKNHEEQLLLLMKELVKNDPISTKIIDITPLGLMEITRKKVNKSLKEQFEG